MPSVAEEAGQESAGLGRLPKNLPGMGAAESLPNLRGLPESLPELGGLESLLVLNKLQKSLVELEKLQKYLPELKLNRILSRIRLRKLHVGNPRKAAKSGRH